MRLTIIIPTYNRINYLKKTLESVIDAIDEETEVIISDNCSTDGTREWLENSSFKNNNIRSIIQKNKIEMYRHWNSLVKQSKGDYFILLSDDDLVSKKMLKEFYDINTDLGMLMFNHVVINENNVEMSRYMNNKYGFIEAGTAFDEFKFGVENRLCSIIFNKRIFFENGGFNEECTLTASDSEIIQKISLKSLVYFSKHEDAVGYYRIWSGSLTQRKLLSKLWHDEIEIWCKNILEFLKEYPEYNAEKIVNNIKFLNYFEAINSNIKVTPKNEITLFMNKIPELKKLTLKKTILNIIFRKYFLMVCYIVFVEKLRKIKKLF